MNSSNPPVDLDNCAREPIHILGNIQPHGVLFVLSPEHFTCLQVSANVDHFLGRSVEDYLGKRLNFFLDEEQIEALRFALSVVDPTENNPVRLGLHAKHEPILLEGIVHSHDGFHFLELEPSAEANQTYFLDFYKAVSKATLEIQSAPDLKTLLDIAARQYQRITGFDRVMIYKFHSGEVGQVIAESVKDDYGTFLDLYYPASDIPEQARKLYVLNPIRLISDVNAAPVPIVPAVNPQSGRPIDLSYAGLRAVSAIHIEYLKNMGVSASMSVSIVRNGKLWGLVACHHYRGAHFVPYETRKACTFIGEVLSLEIAAKESKAEYEYQVNSTVLQARFLERLAGNAGMEALVDRSPNLIDFLDAQGAAVVSKGSVHAIGTTPAYDDISSMATWFEQRNMPALITDCLSEIYVSAGAMKAVSSGVLALEISRTDHTYIMWFRPEQPRVVTWAGNPNKPVEVSEGSFRLSPRKSFEAWKESVGGRSFPWGEAEVRAALNLRKVLSLALFTKGSEKHGE
jgi:light-regulated signal transduction histidine kinase (bacteriophytochrome)